MKILHVLASPHYGGAERMCIALASEHMKAGHETAVFFFHDGIPRQEADKIGIKTIVAESKKNYRTKIRLWQALADALHTVVRREKPDIVHSHVPLTNLICGRALKQTTVPWVATIHGSWKQFAYSPQVLGKPYFKPYLLIRYALGDSWATRRASMILANSTYVKTELAKIGVPYRKIAVIHNGIPIRPAALSKEKAREILSIPRHVPVIASVGYFAPVKGYDLLIRAVAHLKNDFPLLHLLIAGGTVLGFSHVRDALARLAGRLKVSERVWMFDSINPHDGLYVAADVFVVASRTEGFSLALAEAMCYGKPSVVTSAGGCIEVARPGLEGLVFKSGSARNLAKKIACLLTNPELQIQFGEAAALRVRKYFTLEVCARKYERLYLSVLANRQNED